MLKLALLVTSFPRRPFTQQFANPTPSAISLGAGKRAGYSKRSGEVMHEYKRGKLKMGKSGKTVKSRKQAVAIGLSKARREGGKVPRYKRRLLK